jgi:hypothetical protein
MKGRRDLDDLGVLFNNAAQKDSSEPYENMFDRQGRAGDKSLGQVRLRWYPYFPPGDPKPQLCTSLQLDAVPLFP